MRKKRRWRLDDLFSISFTFFLCFFFHPIFVLSPRIHSYSTIHGLPRYVTSFHPAFLDPLHPRSKHLDIHFISPSLSIVPEYSQSCTLYSCNQIKSNQSSPHQSQTQIITSRLFLSGTVNMPLLKTRWLDDTLEVFMLRTI